jgi:Domain of unknown function (DUF1906)
MIIDTPWTATAKLTALKKAGVETIIRYYNFNNSKKLPEKRIEKAEAAAIHAAGMTVAVVFQQFQRDVGDFTADKGKSSFARAIELAGNIGQPAGGVIYFACDVDFIKKTQLAAVETFFTAISASMATLPKAERFMIGAYGSGTVLAMLQAKKLVERTWLAQSTGWSGFKDYKKSKAWALLQGPQTKVGGLDCDTNEANGDFGAF